MRESVPRGVGVGSGVEVGVVFAVLRWLEGTLGGGPVICWRELLDPETC